MNCPVCATPGFDDGICQHCHYSDIPPEDPPHPLRADPHIAAICDNLETHMAQHHYEEHPEDFEYDEGMVVRPEVVVKIIRDYIRDHPEVLS